MKLSYFNKAFSNFSPPPFLNTLHSYEKPLMFQERDKKTTLCFQILSKLNVLNVDYLSRV